MRKLFSNKNMKEVMKEKKILMVGAGGIGCELGKYMSKWGFQQLDIIDLDVIELSNLNRQFYFRKSHVWKPKSKILAEIISKKINKKNPDAKINSYIGNIMNRDLFPMSYFQNFDFILLALDNETARSYLNRICGPLEIPLFEAGTSGFSGQTYPIIWNETRCYDCLPKPKQKTFPVCTIRTVPSKPIHCMIWGKQVFNDLFSTKTENKEKFIKNISEYLQNFSNDIKKIIFEILKKLFIEDLKVLENIDQGTLKSLKFLSEDMIRSALDGKLENNSLFGEDDIKIIQENVHEIELNLSNLIDQKKFDMVFDKDDFIHVDLIRSLGNIRALIYSIPVFDSNQVRKTIGNIVPAISSTNSLISGLLMFNLQKFVLRRKIQETSSNSFVNRLINNFFKIKEYATTKDKMQQIVSSSLIQKKLNCKVCSIKRGHIYLNQSISLPHMGHIIKNELKLKEFSIFFSKFMIYELFPESVENSPEKVNILHTKSISSKNSEILSKSLNDENKKNNSKSLFYILSKYEESLNSTDKSPKSIYELTITNEEDKRVMILFVEFNKVIPSDIKNNNKIKNSLLHIQVLNHFDKKEVLTFQKNIIHIRNYQRPIKKFLLEESKKLKLMEILSSSEKSKASDKKVKLEKRNETEIIFEIKNVNMKRVKV